NSVFGNYFVHNKETVGDFQGNKNLWYNPDLRIGNFWDDWNGIDNVYSIPNNKEGDIFPRRIALVSNDLDSDGMADSWELAHGLNISINDADQDKDNDEVTNLAEYQWGSNPEVNDSDNDGLSDFEEIFYGGDPRRADKDSDGLLDYDEVNIYSTYPFWSDSDMDNLSDYDEIFNYKTDALSPDSDNDYLLDGLEVIYNTNPLVADTDGDGLLDGEEILIYGTNALKKDTDGDGWNDLFEIEHGYDPLSRKSTFTYKLVLYLVSCCFSLILISFIILRYISRKKGFSSIIDYLQAIKRGFKNKEELIEITNAGFVTKKQFATAKQFGSKTYEQYISFYLELVAKEEQYLNQIKQQQNTIKENISNFVNLDIKKTEKELIQLDKKLETYSINKKIKEIERSLNKSECRSPNILQLLSTLKQNQKTLFTTYFEELSVFTQKGQEVGFTDVEEYQLALRRGFQTKQQLLKAQELAAETYNDLKVIFNSNLDALNKKIEETNLSLHRIASQIDTQDLTAIKILQDQLIDLQNQFSEINVEYDLLSSYGIQSEILTENTSQTMIELKSLLATLKQQLATNEEFLQQKEKFIKAEKLIQDVKTLFEKIRNSYLSSSPVVINQYYDLIQEKRSIIKEINNTIKTIIVNLNDNIKRKETLQQETMNLAEESAFLENELVKRMEFLKPWTAILEYITKMEEGEQTTIDAISKVARCPKDQVHVIIRIILQEDASLGSYYDIEQIFVRETSVMKTIDELLSVYDEWEKQGKGKKV
ncbi:MAG: hypothetical protein ACTSPI_10215, partial [Candidatus Heimdallarchaeaceae archaeon]